MTEAFTDRRIELATTILLTFAAVATAWSTYQSARWHGKQALAQSASIAARVESTRQANVANRQAQVDIALFTQWVDAYAGGDKRLATFYRERFRPRFKPAFEAWVALRPLRNPKAPSSPFDMPQYKLAASAEADRLDEVAAEASQNVKTHIQRADNYTLAVVLFAVSLFCAGISSKLGSRSSRLAILVLGWAVFAGALVWIAMSPVTVSV